MSWREEEKGRAREGLAAPAPEPRIWKDDEGGGPDEEARRSAAAPLWREEEGRAPERRHRRRPPPPPPARRRRESHATGRARRRSRRSAWRHVPLALVLLLVLLAGDGAYSALSLERSLRSMAADLDDAADALDDRDVDAARRHLVDAVEQGRRSAGLIRHPGFVLPAFLPGIGRDARALSALAEAGQAASEGGLDAVEAAARLGVGGDGLGETLYDGGRVRLETVAAVAPLVSSAEARLAEAAGWLAAAPDPTTSLVGDALAEARERVGDALATAARGDDLFSVLPGLLGGDDPRRYLLVFQATGEARATGGVAGLYGVLEAEDGRLDLTEIGPYGDLFPRDVRPVAAPDWFTASYGPQGALVQWPQANVSPNLAAVAGVQMKMYRQAAGRPVDGVIAMDPLALEELMGATGALTVASGGGAPVRVTQAEVAELLLVDLYLEAPDPDEQNAFLAGVVRAFWDRLSAGDVDVERLADAFGEAAASGHLKVFTAADAERAALGGLGLDDGYDPGVDAVQMVFHNNYGVNKVDYYLRRALDTDVSLGADGAATVTTSVRLDNRAPDGPPSPLLGLAGGAVPPGTNRMTLSFLLPAGAVPERLEVDRRRRTPLVHEDEGHPVVWSVLSIPPRAVSVATAAYVWPDAASLAEDTGTFSMSFVPQPAVTPDELTVTVEPPRGFRFDSVDGADVRPDGSALFTGTFDRPVVIAGTLVRR